MTGIIIPVAYLLSGVSAYASLTHLQVGLRQPTTNLKHILFAAMCLCASIASVFNLSLSRQILFLHLFLPPDGTIR
jgi:Mn2+/Fe2+ NRAMP family transporter